MIVVRDNPVGSSDARVPETSNGIPDFSGPAPLSDLFNDPEVRRRVGQVISKAARGSSEPPHSDTGE